MLQLIRDAWGSASDAVRIAIVVAVAALLITAIVYGVDLTWLPGLLGSVIADPTPLLGGFIIGVGAHQLSR